MKFFSLKYKALNPVANAKEGFLSKGPKTQWLLVARAAEDPPALSAPEGAGKLQVAVVEALAVEAQLRIKAPHTEQLQKASRINNRFHGDENPFAAGLILVLQAQLRADFGRTKLQTELLGAFVYLVVLIGVQLVEAEFADRDLNQVYFGFLGGHCKSGLSENIRRLVAEPEFTIAQDAAKVLGGID